MLYPDSSDTKILRIIHPFIHTTDCPPSPHPYPHQPIPQTTIQRSPLLLHHPTPSSDPPLTYRARIHSEAEIAAERYRLSKLMKDGTPIFTIFDTGCSSYRQIKKAYLPLSAMLHPDHARKEDQEQANECLKLLSRSVSLVEQFCEGRLVQLPNDDLSIVCIPLNMKFYYSDELFESHLTE